MNLKKIIALALCVCMVLSFFPVSVFAEDWEDEVVLVDEEEYFEPQDEYVEEEIIMEEPVDYVEYVEPAEELIVEDEDVLVEEESELIEEPAPAEEPAAPAAPAEEPAAAELETAETFDGTLPVAFIGEYPYSSLLGDDGAIAEAGTVAAGGGTVIRLVRDVEENLPEINKTVSFTGDFTITTAAFTVSSGTVAFENKAIVGGITVSGGAVTIEADVKGSIKANGGTLKLDGSTVTGEDGMTVDGGDVTLVGVTMQEPSIAVNATSGKLAIESGSYSTVRGTIAGKITGGTYNRVYKVLLADGYDTDNYADNDTYCSGTVDKTTQEAMSGEGAARKYFNLNAIPDDVTPKLLKDASYTMNGDAGAEFKVKLNGYKLNVTAATADLYAEPSDPDDDGVTTYTLKHTVAVIGEGTEAKYFDSLAGAIAAAEDGNTIKLLTNAELGACTFPGIRFAIDVNEKTLTLTGQHTFAATDLTIKNGNVIAKDAGGNGVFSTDYGTDMALTLDGVVLETSNVTGLTCMNSNSDSLTIKDSQLTLKGCGSYVLYTQGAAVLIDRSSIEISDSMTGDNAFEAPFSFSVYNIKDSTIELKDGVARNAFYNVAGVIDHSTIILRSQDDGVVMAENMSDFTGDVNTLRIINESILSVTTSGENTKAFSFANNEQHISKSEDSTILPAVFEAAIGEEYYPTLAAAVAAAATGENKTITLLKDVQLPDRVWVTSDVTIDGAGFTIMPGDTPAFNDERLITDKGHASGNGLTLINLANGVTGVTIKDVTLTSTNSIVSPAKDLYPRALIGTGTNTTITLEKVTLNHTSTTINGADALALNGDCTIVGEFSVALSERSWSAISFNTDGETLDFSKCTSFDVTEDTRTDGGKQPIIIAYFPNGEVLFGDSLGMAHVSGATTQTGFDPVSNNPKLPSVNEQGQIKEGSVYNYKVGTEYFATFSAAAAAAQAAGEDVYVEVFKAPAASDTYTLSTGSLKVKLNGKVADINTIVKASGAAALTVVGPDADGITTVTYESDVVAFVNTVVDGANVRTYFTTFAAAAEFGIKNGRAIQVIAGATLDAEDDVKLAADQTLRVIWNDVDGASHIKAADPANYIVPGEADQWGAIAYTVDVIVAQITDAEGNVISSHNSFAAAIAAANAYAGTDTITVTLFDNVSVDTGNSNATLFDIKRNNVVIDGQGKYTVSSYTTGTELIVGGWQDGMLKGGRATVFTVYSDNVKFKDITIESKTNACITTSGAATNKLILENVYLDHDEAYYGDALMLNTSCDIIGTFGFSANSTTWHGVVEQVAGAIVDFSDCSEFDFTLVPGPNGEAAPGQAFFGTYVDPTTTDGSARFVGLAGLKAFSVVGTDKTLVSFAAVDATTKHEDSGYEPSTSPKITTKYIASVVSNGQTVYYETFARAAADAQTSGDTNAYVKLIGEDSTTYGTYALTSGSLKVELNGKVTGEDAIKALVTTDADKKVLVSDEDEQGITTYSLETRTINTSKMDGGVVVVRKWYDKMTEAVADLQSGEFIVITATKAYEFSKDDAVKVIYVKTTGEGVEFNPTVKESDIGYSIASRPDSNPTGSIRYEIVPNTFSVHFNANGGTGNMDDQPFTYDVEQPLNANTFTNASAKFMGWATSQADADALKVTYANQQSVSNLDPTNNATVTLYAVWESEAYLIDKGDHKHYRGTIDDAIAYRAEHVEDGWFDADSPIYLNADNVTYPLANVAATLTINLNGHGDTFKVTPEKVTIPSEYDPAVGINPNYYVVEPTTVDGMTTYSCAQYIAYVKTQPYTYTRNNDGTYTPVPGTATYMLYDTFANAADAAVNPTPEAVRPAEVKTVVLLQKNPVNYELAAGSLSVDRGSPAKDCNVVAPTGKRLNMSDAGTVRTFTLVETVTVTFDMNGKTGTAPAALTIDKGAKATEPADDPTTTDGYTFTNWYANAAATGDPFDFDTPITADTTIFAGWTATPYTIAYTGGAYTNPNASITEYTVETRDNITFADAESYGWHFDGWKLNGALLQNGKLPTGTTGDITLEATWSKNNYDVTFVTPADVPTPDAQRVPYNTKAEKPDDPDRDYYDFKGWYKHETPEEGETAFDFDTLITEATTLYAYYLPTEYTITYYLNGGELGEGVTNPTKYTVETETFTLKNPTKANWTFDGWTGSNGEATGQSTVTITKGSHDDLEFGAHYKYTATFVMNGGTPVVPAQTNMERVLVTEPDDPTLTDATFDGWYTDAAFEHQFDFATAPDGNVTLYAKFVGDPRTIVFMDDDYTHRIFQTLNMNVGDTLPNYKPTSLPTRPGYALDENDLWTPSIRDEQGNLKKVTTDQVFNLNWKQMFNVDFEVNDAVIKSIAGIVSGGTIPKADMPVVRKDGKVAKWVDKVTGEEFIFADGTVENPTQVTANLVLVASWDDTPATLADFTYNMSLTENLNMKFYVRNVKDYIEDYTVKVSIDGEDDKVFYLDNAEENIFTIAEFDARRMTDEIHVVVMDGDTEALNKVYTIAGYCNAVIESTGNEKLKELANAILVYGANAQVALNYKTDNLPTDDYDVTGVIIPTATATTKGSVTGVSRFGNKVMVDSYVTLRVMIQVDSTASVGDYTVTANDTEVVPVKQNATNWYVDIPVSALKLGEKQVLYVENDEGLAVYSLNTIVPMRRVNNELARALYAYYDAATAYATSI